MCVCVFVFVCVCVCAAGIRICEREITEFTGNNMIVCIFIVLMVDKPRSISVGVSFPEMLSSVANITG